MFKFEPSGIEKKCIDYPNENKCNQFKKYFKEIEGIIFYLHRNFYTFQYLNEKRDLLDLVGFPISLLTLQESIILNLGKLLSRDRRDITFQTLINEMTRECDLDLKLRCEEFVAKNREKCDRLGRFRNKKVAHLDKEIQELSISMEDVMNVLREFEKIVIDIHAFYEGEQLNFRLLEEDIDGFISILEKGLKQDN